MTKTRLFTEDDLRSTIGLFLEYREVHGFCEDDAALAAVNEVIEGYDASIELHDAGEIKNLPVGEAVQRRGKDSNQ